MQRPDGRVDAYMRYGDTYLKHDDGSLDVVRLGARAPYGYAAGTWTGVEGDEQKRKKKRRRLFG